MSNALTRTLAAALGVLLLVLAGAPAAAQGQSYPGERAARNALVNELQPLATAYLVAQGHRPCAAPVILLATDLSGPDTPGLVVNGRADKGACTLWLHDAMVAEAQDLSTGGADHLCRVLTHELGHLAGLAHEDADPIMHGVTPRFCITWARQHDRRKARAWNCIGHPRRPACRRAPAAPRRAK